jgi:hypothetical protein
LARAPEGWRLVFCRRKVTELAGLTVTPQFGHELNDWAALVGEPVVVWGFDEVEVRAVAVPLNEAHASFFRLAVTVDAP